MKLFKNILLIFFIVASPFIVLFSPALGVYAVVKPLCMALGDDALKIYIPLEEWKQLRGIKETEALRFNSSFQRHLEHGWNALSEIKNQSDYKKTIKHNGKIYKLSRVKKTGDISEYGWGKWWWRFHKGSTLYYDNVLGKILGEATEYMGKYDSYLDLIPMRGDIYCRFDSMTKLDQAMSQYNAKGKND